MRYMTELTSDKIAQESLLLKIGVLAMCISSKCVSGCGNEFSAQRCTVKGNDR